MRNFVIFEFLILLVVSFSSSFAQEIKICTVNNENPCQSMERDLMNKDYKIKCVQARDRIECMKFVANGTADVVNLPINEAYVSFLNFSLQPLAKEGIDGQEAGYIYHGVAVVRKSSNIKSLADLKSKKACHTAYGRTTGWSMPVALLQANVSQGEKCNEFEFMSSLFAKSCVPGNWSSDGKLNDYLKKKYKNLCELCKTKCENANDPYIGYEGALTCLLETNADVAFTKHSVVQNFFTENQKRDYLYLCANGSTSTLDQPCYLSTRPTNLFMMFGTPITMEKRIAWVNILSRALIDFSATPPWATWLSQVLVSSPNVTSIKLEENTTAKVLENANYKIVIDKPVQEPCKEKYVRFCVMSELGKQKCEDFKAAAFAQRLRPHVDCYEAESRDACLVAISEGKADIVAADTGDVFKGANSYKLVPIMAEQYGPLNMSYYAVAVIHTSSSITKFEDLKGLKSCHTGEGRTAGWNVPVGQMVKSGLLKSAGCSAETEVAKFFSASCVPGARSDSKERLCSLCIGDEEGNNKCVAKDSERYSGYSGAFRCLVEKGNVSFVKHSTVMENTDGKNKADWALNLKSTDYSLLCPNGRKVAVGDYENCNLAKIPSHQVIISSKKTEGDKLDIALMLASASNSFGPNKTSFKLFGSYYNVKDLVFKDSATNLVSFVKESSISSTAKETLGDNLYNDLLSVYCNGAHSKFPVSFMIVGITIYHFIQRLF